MYKNAFRVWILAPIFAAAAGFSASRSVALSYAFGVLAIVVVIVGLVMAIVGIIRKEPATRNR